MSGERLQDHWSSGLNFSRLQQRFLASQNLGALRYTINLHTKPYSRIFDWVLFLFPLFLCTISDGSGQTMLMNRLMTIYHEFVDRIDNSVPRVTVK